jgi:hypothetical protein
MERMPSTQQKPNKLKNRLIAAGLGVTALANAYMFHAEQTPDRHTRGSVLPVVTKPASPHLPNFNLLSRLHEEIKVVPTPIHSSAAVASRSRSTMPTKVSNTDRFLPLRVEDWAIIIDCESGGRPRETYTSNRGTTYYGAFQFNLATFHSVGGVGNPVDYSLAKQQQYANVLQARDGSRQWACSLESINHVQDIPPQHNPNYLPPSQR